MMKRGPIVIKKYGNRRLYDTGDSRYITLDELAGKIRRGDDVRVIDAKSGDDLTQATLTQIIIESRGAARLLPVPLLTQLIRLGDDALAEFFGRYVTAALGFYLQAKRGVQAALPVNPFAMPMAATDALTRMWMGGPWPFGGDAGWAPEPEPRWEPPGSEGTEARAGGDDEVAELRRELEKLKRTVGANRESTGEAEAGGRRPGRSRRRGGKPRR